MTTPYRGYTEIPASAVPDVPYRVNLALREVDADIYDVAANLGANLESTAARISAEQANTDTRLSSLEVLGALAPGDLSDATAADLIANPGTLTRGAVNTSLKTDDALARAQAMAFASRPQPLSRWRTKLAAEPATAKIVGMGDSTSDPATDAVQIWDRLKNYHTLAGKGLEGMAAANIVSYGHNGTKLSGWWGTPEHKAEITGSGAHLVILSYGINDFRLGETTPAAFRALLIDVVNYLRANMPGTDIVLRIPNSFTSDNVHTWSVGWVSPATPEASQKYSTELREVYLSLVDHWADGVAVWDAQGRTFGVTAKPFAQTDGLMKDILHPSGAKGYPAIADALVADLIGRHAIPARVTPAGSIKPLYDMMGRADNAFSAGIATTGQVYETTIGGFGISAHRLYNPGSSLARTTIDTHAANAEYGITVAVAGATLVWGFRYASSQNFLYITHGGAGKYELWKMTAGTTANVATFSTVTPANGDRLMVRADGPFVRVYINGALVGSYDFPDHVAGTKLTVQANNSTPRVSDLYSTPYSN